MRGSSLLTLSCVMLTGCYGSHALPEDLEDVEGPWGAVEETCADGERLPDWLVGDFTLVGQGWECIGQDVNLRIGACGATTFFTASWDFLHSHDGHTERTWSGFRFVSEGELPIIFEPLPGELIEAENADWGVMWMQRRPEGGVRPDPAMVGRFCEGSSPPESFEDCYPNCPMAVEIDEEGRYAELVSREHFCLEGRGDCVYVAKGVITRAAGERAVVHYDSSWGLCTEEDARVEVRALGDGDIEVAHSFLVYDPDVDYSGRTATRRVNRVRTRLSRDACPPGR